MPDRPTLVADERTIIGKKVKHLRRDGIVPGIIYGTLVEEPIPVQMDSRDFLKLYIDYGNISLIDVHVNGDVHTVYIRNVHQHPVTRDPFHAELYAPNLLVRMSAAVPIILYGESENLEGVVTQLRDNVEVEGLPTDLPGAIEIDVSGLIEIDDSVAVGEINLPDNVELLTDPEDLIVRLMEVRLVLEDEEVEGEEGELESEEGEIEGEEGETDEEQEFDEE